MEKLNSIICVYYNNNNNNIFWLVIWTVLEKWIVLHWFGGGGVTIYIYKAPYIYILWVYNKSLKSAGEGYGKQAKQGKAKQSEGG